MKITAEIEKYKWNGYYREYLGKETELIEVEQVSDWRKGLCICKEETKKWNSPENRYLTSYRMFLVNTDLIAIFYHNSDYFWELADLNSLPIERFFGGFYIVYEGKSICLGTYPGQDRDTEYRYTQVICKVISDDGKVLDNAEKDLFLQTHTLQKGKELGDNRVLLDNSLYSLDDYSFIAKLPQGVELVGKYTEGKIKANVKKDFRDFYVLVQRRKIIKSFEAKVFTEAIAIVDPTFLKEDNRPFRKKPIPTETEDAVEIIPEYVSIIDGYLYGFPDKYGASCTNIPKGWLDRVILYQGEFSGYFKERGKWYKVKHEEIYNMMKQMQEDKFPIPNFITEISFIKKVKYQSESAGLYLFKCRPYGYLNTLGELEYAFDPDNIIW